MSNNIPLCLICASLLLHSWTIKKAFKSVFFSLGLPSILPVPAANLPISRKRKRETHKERDTPKERTGAPRCGTKKRARAAAPPPSPPLAAPPPLLLPPPPQEEAPPPPESPLFDDGAAEGPDARYLRAARDADPNHVSDHLQRLAARLLQYQPGNDFSAPFLNVDLNFQSIRDVGCRVLAAGLKGSTVRRLHLVGNRITDVGVGHLAEGLRANKSLGELYLNENQITDAGMGKLCVALGFLPALHLLNVSCNPVTERGVKELAMLLVQPTCRLRALFLGGTSGMKRPPQLDVGRPEGVKPGAEAAGRRKRPPPPPKIGDAGALCLAAALLAPHGPPLRALGLSRCDLGKKGLQALGVALCFKNDLTYLNLSGNKVGKDAYNFFVKALEVNPRLRELGLAGCHLKKAEVARLRGLLVGGAAGGVKPALSWDQQKQRAREAVDLRAWVIEQGKKLGVVYPKSPDRLEDDAPAFPPAGPPAPPLPGGGLPPLDDGDGGGGGEPPRRLVALASRGASAGPGPAAGPPLLHRTSSPDDDVDVPSGAGALLSAPLHEGLPSAEVRGWLAAAARTLADLERRRKLAAESQDMAEKEASKMQAEENELISEYSKDCQQVAKELKDLQLEEDKLRIKINDLEAAAAARAAAARGALDALAAAEALRGGSIAAARDVIRCLCTHTHQVSVLFPELLP